MAIPSCMGETLVTDPSHSPARLLTVLKEIWEAVAAGGGVVDWAKDMAESVNKTAVAIDRSDFTG